MGANPVFNMPKYILFFFFFNYGAIRFGQQMTFFGCKPELPGDLGEGRGKLAPSHCPASFMCLPWQRTPPTHTENIK